MGEESAGAVQLKAPELTTYQNQVGERACNAVCIPQYVASSSVLLARLTFASHSCSALSINMCCNEVYRLTPYR